MEGIRKGRQLREGSRGFELSLPAQELAEAVRTTHIETDISDMPFSAGFLADTLASEGMRTYRLIPESHFSR